MKLLAQNNYFICKPYELQNQSSNSLLIQNSNSDNMAQIIDLHEDIAKVTPYYIGDIILYNKDNAEECVVNNEKYIVVELTDIYAIIKEETNND
nr:MAG TPA: 10 kDa chaperonin [Caudoviricetes sp.]